ncbi:MAG: prepilin-type N-terminal cleavage/methylation domain-containing protein [Acidobacteria bacterium]|nr:prepilin-type N-terminal cleavage/methylation domain-containing protein [Acidobacteriota bacterium]MBI3262648.1 prepilin-type N-terminal cleavage/methylation domain-containing protein [Acidobacteriota bacterium]
MKTERGFTLIELLIVVAVIAIIAAIAIPGLMRAKQSGGEASAIGSLRAINGAQSSFASSCGAGYYSPSLTNLGSGPGGTPGVNGFVSPDLSSANSVMKSGYTVTMSSSQGVAATAPASCNGLAAGAVVQGYNATAVPNPGAGARSFATNTTGTIYQKVGMTIITVTDQAVTDAAATVIQ